MFWWGHPASGSIIINTNSNNNDNNNNNTINNTTNNTNNNNTINVNNKISINIRRVSRGRSGGVVQLEVFQLAEERLNMPVWKYNDKCYLTNNESWFRTN